MALRIRKDFLEDACKDIIETILFCLPNAYKGTVYTIGSPPEMTATRITSGVIDEHRRTISWGLPEKSDYNPPGKPWLEYRDEPGRPLEAMAWCVERQKSWTAQNPIRDPRSGSGQIYKGKVDSHHMEPVLIRKKDLFLGEDPPFEYPRNYVGETIWKETEYVVVAVIKIHFEHESIKVDSPETRVIKRLSRALGTELLSYQLREQSLEAMRELAQDKVNSCNILSDSLRNTISKSGLIFSLIKQELGFLRDQWEHMLRGTCKRGDAKREAIENLEYILTQTGHGNEELAREIREAQKKFLTLSLPPERGENWIRMQIVQRWNLFLEKYDIGDNWKHQVIETLNDLKKSLYLGRDSEMVALYKKIPEDLKKEWLELIYETPDRFDQSFLDRVIEILGNSALNLPYQEKSRKSLIHLKALASIMGELEEHTNVALRQVLNGNNKKFSFSGGLRG